MEKTKSRSSEGAVESEHIFMGGNTLPFSSLLPDDFGLYYLPILATRLDDAGCIGRLLRIPNVHQRSE